MAPGLESQRTILKLLKASDIGVSLTSGYQLVPECSTTALILIHPEAKYFKI
jgi:5-methyltetrahydrofolate--homocysteine methyltransferase